MIERNVLDSFTEKISATGIDILSVHDELLDIIYEYNETLATEVSVDFDASNLEDIKERIKTAIENLQNLVSEIDELDL